MRFITEAIVDCDPMPAGKAFEVINHLKLELASNCSSGDLASELNYAFTWADTPMGREPWALLYQRLGTCKGSDIELRLQLAMLVDKLESMLAEAVLDGTYGDDA